MLDIKEWIKTQRIAVLYGGDSSEREVSIKSGKAVANALRSIDCDVVEIDVGADVARRLIDEKITFAFIALHGKLGEDGTVQGLLEILKIPYSGSGVLASALALNKHFAKQLFRANGIPTPDWIILDKVDAKSVINFGLPCVIKPVAEGSTIGVSIVKNETDIEPAMKEAFKYDKEIIVEKYIPGKELTVGILGDVALAVMEILPESSYYDYYSKYTPGKSIHLIPAPIDKKAYEEAQILALKAFKSLGCKATARVDMRYDGKNVYVLEVNTIPGMTETSLLPEAAKYYGIEFHDLVLEIIKYSLR